LAFPLRFARFSLAQLAETKENGGHTTVGHAMAVDAEPVPTGAPASSGHDGIVLKDSDGNVVGRFFQAEIVGYLIHEASGRSGFH
jgi:hypothetical protein